MRTKLPMEAVTAVVFSSGVAIALLFLPIGRAEAALVGDISKAGVGDTVFSVFASLAIIVTVRCTDQKLILGNISEELAASVGADCWTKLSAIYLSSAA
jgi:ABC-type Mn2+/Zn2+ transport system permease subunit